MDETDVHLYHPSDACRAGDANYRQCCEFATPMVRCRKKSGIVEPYSIFSLIYNEFFPGIE